MTAPARDPPDIVGLCCRLLGLAAAAALLLLAAIPALADSWSLPRRETYWSADRQVRLTVTPRGISSPLRYFEDQAARRPSPGQQPGAAASARGLLERRTNGRWERVWERPLLNEVAPVTALVAPGGRYAVTFDNWHSAGYGDTVVVIYDSAGEPVRALGLTDFLPADYVEALPHTVSSIWWGGDHRFSADGDRLVLSVVIPSGESGLSGAGRVELQIDLATGQPIAPTGRAWTDALAAAVRVAGANREAEVAARAAFVAPVVAPTAWSELAWFQYLQEAFFRLDPDWREDYPAAQVLRPRDASDFAESEAHLREAFGEDRLGDVLMVGGPSQDDLVEVLVDALRRLRPGALAGMRIYIVVDDAHRAPVAAALAPTGATFIQLDPARPIPQRPERIRLRDGGMEASEE